ncbi:putative Non-structural maintenance of chromosomes element 1-like protein [Hypsibius exemplaris]|uniref:Non-structural maintenance of chromosomes element 1 homolog n=1 Tax=Hypsibius exemplaris TaxID=2072580 RepID=A0A1W0XCF6_HYPEX|nr:putative Non-structural maintenance of chromosomes element 1-like protein [Hypsibius exemplaris]
MAQRATRSQRVKSQPGMASTHASSSVVAPSHASSSAVAPSQVSSAVSDPLSLQDAFTDFGTYGVFHKAVLGVFIAQSILDAQEVRRMFQQTCAACHVECPTDPREYMTALATTMGAINARIKKYHLTLKKICAEPPTINSYYCLVNKSSHGLHQQQDFFKRNELEYLLELAKEILESDGGFITSHAAGDIIISSKVTQTGAGNLLEKFARQKFIVQDEKRGRVMLGPRALAELEPLIQIKHPEAVKKCSFCQGIITVQGIKCEKCQGLCHPACLVRQLDPDSTGNVELPCSYCQANFLRETLDKYRGLAKKKCDHLEGEREDEMTRQAKADKLNFGDRGDRSGSAAAGRSNTADQTMDLI